MPRKARHKRRLSEEGGICAFIFPFNGHHGITFLSDTAPVEVDNQTMQI